MHVMGEEKDTEQLSRREKAERIGQLMERRANFWRWLCRPRKKHEGFRRIKWRHLVFYVFVAAGGTAIMHWQEISIEKCATGGLLTLIAILVGVAFSWVGNAIALISDTDFTEVIRSGPGGIQTYVFSYLLSVLIIAVSLVLWGLGSLGLFAAIQGEAWVGYRLIQGLMLVFAVASVHHAWRIVLSAQKAHIAADIWDRYTDGDIDWEQLEESFSGEKQPENDSESTPDVNQCASRNAQNPKVVSG